MQYRHTATVLLLFLWLILSDSPAFADVPADEQVLVQDNITFALDLYDKLSATEGNIFFSPHSISTALAMTYAGARGETETQMAKTLRFSLDQRKLPPAFAKLESRLNRLQKAGNVRLSVANSLWPQDEYKFLGKYLALTKKYYRVLITPVDYKRSPELARKMINEWVEDKTEEKIKNLIPAGVLDALTRLVLVNAIYFKGNWASQFKPDQTRDAPFHVSPGTSVQTPMMNQKGSFGYAELEDLQILQLPYTGNELSMLVLLPKEIDGIKRLENRMSLEKLEQWKGSLHEREVLVFLPKFKMTSMFRLDQTLMALGMIDAFSMGRANFTGMDGKAGWLYIGALLHKAFVDLNEEGTEAAAATSVIMEGELLPAPPPTFRADHPFMFLIQESKTGAILFMGRVIDPTKTGE